MSVTAGMLNVTNMTGYNYTSSSEYVYDYVDCDDGTNGTLRNQSARSLQNIEGLTMFLVTSYVVICVAGLVGNGLVIYVVLRFAKMKTVTNMYILNLAISDLLFLTSLPFLVTTTLLHHWIFGTAMCKIYFVLFSINFFTSVFSLTALSADRYLAVCHPVRSGQYRTTTIAFFVCLVIWSFSFFVMLPIILYSTTLPNRFDPAKETCTIHWPDGQPIAPDKAFTWYTFLLGFAIPVSMISVLYLLVIIRLQHVGPAIKSKERKRSHRRVTRMVLAVISVYILCWLPYWVFQMNLTFKSPASQTLNWEIYLFNGFTVLTFANSMLNPLLYAFLSDNFRRSFAKAFKCASKVEADKSLCNENSVFPKHKQHRNSSGYVIRTEENFEMATMITSADHAGIPKTGSASSLNDGSGMYVDKESQTLQEDV